MPGRMQQDTALLRAVDAGPRLPRLAHRRGTTQPAALRVLTRARPGRGDRHAGGGLVSRRGASADCPSMVKTSRSSLPTRRRRLHDDAPHDALRIVQLDLELHRCSRHADPRADPLTRRLLPLRRVLEQRLRRLPAALQRARHLDQPQPVRLVADLVRVASLVRPAATRLWRAMPPPPWGTSRKGLVYFSRHRLALSSEPAGRPTARTCRPSGEHPAPHNTLDHRSGR
jgi:hypothetical protein